MDSISKKTYRALKAANDEYERSSTQLSVLESQYLKLKIEAVDLQKAKATIQTAAELVQEKAHRKIGSLVTRCLSLVFDEPYEFKIEFGTNRSATESKLLFIRDGEEFDPMTASGGGVVEVASFGMRLACLLVAQPQRRRLLVLDEPFKFVSANYQERVRSMVETLAEELDIQFIIVTHIEELQMGTIVRI